MDWINTSEFAKIGKFSKQTAWRKIKTAPKEYTKLGSRVLLINKSYAQKLIDNNTGNYISPDHIAKELRCSSPYVRKILGNEKPAFAQQLPNRRWRIRDCEAYRSWLELLKKKYKKIQRKNKKSGKGSGIINYFGVVADFKRWQNKIGGIDGPLKWETHHQIRFIEETIEIARQRHHIIKSFSDSDFISLNFYSLTDSERLYFTKYQKSDSNLNLNPIND
jgi:hypothetical protein